MQAGGFVFSFKMYIPNAGNRLDCIENLVHHLTHSDLIHVEIIPILGMHPDTQQLLASPMAHTAYVGQGYSCHHSSSCINDGSYMHLFVPMQDHALVQKGLDFLQGMQGKRYNYMALPFTILPENCKFRAIHKLSNSLTIPSKVFCSQMGLMLCYLCGIIRPEYHYHGHSIIFDPSCCTPADLYRLLIGSDSALACTPDQITIHDEAALCAPVPAFPIYEMEACC